MRFVSLLMCGVALLALPGKALADDVTSQREAAVQLITNAANTICSTPLQHGHDQNSNVSASLDAAVKGLAAKLAKLGAKGTAQLTNTEYEGVTREQLLQALKDSNTCKNHVFDVLSDRMLPSLRCVVQFGGEAHNNKIGTLNDYTGPTVKSVCFDDKTHDNDVTVINKQ
jgi:hypothetical protein